MRGEGFTADEIDLELTVSDGQGRRLAHAGGDRLTELALPHGEPLSFELSATCTVAKPGLPREELDSTEAKPRGQREVWLQDGGQEIPIYDRDAAERHWERLNALYKRNLV